MFDATFLLDKDEFITFFSPIPFFHSRCLIGDAWFVHQERKVEFSATPHFIKLGYCQTTKDGKIVKHGPNTQTKAEN